MEMRFLKPMFYVLAYSLAAVGTVHAMGPKPRPDTSPAAQAYTWYDDGHERPVWRDSGMVAEFDPPAKETSAVSRAYTGASVVRGGRGNVRLWSVGKGNADSTLQSARAIQPTAKVSPVFRDTPGAGGRIRALPGNVIVTFRPDWTEAQVRAWAKGRGLELVRPLNVNNAWVIRTEPGTAALDLANTLHRSGEVVAATPYWWVEVTKR